MISQIPIHNTLITSLHKNRSLILQFLLEEFLFAGIEISKLTSLDEVALVSIEELKYTFTALGGPIQELLSCLAWNHEQGILLKLKLYSTTFIAGNSHHLSKYIHLEKSSTLLWKTSLEIISLLNQSEQKKREHLKKEPLKKKIKYFISTFNKLSSTITDCIKDFPSDENLIFFLLRNKTKFERIYGADHIKKLLLEIHPEGISQAAMLLKNRFVKRGFNTIAEQFSTKYLELYSS